MCTCTDAEVLDTETIECEDKTIVLQMKENTQGKFIKMTEVGVSNSSCIDNFSTNV